MKQDHGNKLNAMKRRLAVRKWFDRSDLEQAMPKDAVDIVERICDRLVETGESLKTICAPDPSVRGAPKLAALLYWRRADPRINAAIMAARAARAEVQWAMTEEQIEDEFEHAFRSGDKLQIMATERKMALLLRARIFEVQKLVPGIYGGGESLDAGTQRDEKTIEAALARMKADGHFVQDRLLVLPPKEKKDNLPLAPGSRPAGAEAKDVELIIDIPAKGVK